MLGSVQSVLAVPWSTSVEGDEQPYRPSQSVKVKFFCFSCVCVSFLKLVYQGAGTVVDLLLLKSSMAVPTFDSSATDGAYLPISHYITNSRLCTYQLCTYLSPFK